MAKKKPNNGGQAAQQGSQPNRQGAPGSSPGSKYRRREDEGREPVQGRQTGVPGQEGHRPEEPARGSREPGTSDELDQNTGRQAGGRAEDQGDADAGQQRNQGGAVTE